MLLFVDLSFSLAISRIAYILPFLLCFSMFYKIWCASTYMYHRQQSPISLNNIHKMVCGK